MTPFARRIWSSQQKWVKLFKHLQTGCFTLRNGTEMMIMEKEDLQIISTLLLHKQGFLSFFAIVTSIHMIYTTWMRLLYCTKGKFGNILWKGLCCCKGYAYICLVCECYRHSQIKTHDYQISSQASLLHGMLSVMKNLSTQATKMFG
jgi:hypothetical protein